MTPYAELQVASNFSFLRGASHPDELVAQAAALGLCRDGSYDARGTKRRCRRGIFVLTISIT